jgi:hypothetical protein
LFLQTNDRIINLTNVSNINILVDKNRIVFNLNYSIEIDANGKNKLISDYVYWDSVNKDNLELNIKHLGNNNYFKDNFLTQPSNYGFININEISSVKLSEKKNRVIFNLSHPITFKDYDGNERITSEFVYVNCKDGNEFKQYINYVKSILGE